MDSINTRRKSVLSRWNCTGFGKSFAMILGLLISIGGAQAQLTEEQLRVEIEPLARSAKVDTTVTFFTSFINVGATVLSNCQTSLVSNIPASLSTFDLSGNPLTPFSLAPYENRNLKLNIVANAAFPSTQVFFDFVCEDPEGASVKAPIIPGVNVVVLTASDTPIADVIAWTSNEFLTTNPSDYFFINALNIGVGAQITVVPNTGAMQLPLILNVCELDKSSGTCLTAPAPSVTTTIDEFESALFVVFATSEGTISPDPANSRIFVPFLEQQGEVRGLTSVTVTSAFQSESGEVLPGAWEDNEKNVCFNVSLDGSRLTPKDSTCPDGSSLSLDLRGFNVSGIPCDVLIRSKQEVPISPVSHVFEFVEITQDASPLGILSTAYVWAQFKDPVLLNAGGAVTFQNAQGVCPGGWLDAMPAP